MKKKLKDAISVRHILMGVTMKSMNPDDAWALIKCNTILKRAEDNFESFREETVAKFKPQDWEEKIEQVQIAEDQSSDMDAETRRTFLEYRDAFLTPVNRILSTELASDIDVECSISEDIIRKLVIDNNFDMEKACEVLAFFQP